MPALNWLNENSNRAFPFLKYTAGVATPPAGTITVRQMPNAWIIDAGFVMGLKSGFIAGEHKVWLNRVSRMADRVDFEFCCDAPNLHGLPLVFSRYWSADVAYETEDLDSDGDHSSQSEAGCEPPLWSGYLTTGDLTNLDQYAAEIRGSGDDGTLEPALIQNLADTYVNSFNLANADRTRATAPLGCPPLTWPFDPGVIFVTAECLQGDVYWKPGYNCAIHQSPQANSLTISAIVNSGAGQPCNEEPCFPGDAPPIGHSNEFYSGSLACNQTLRAVNGLGGPMLSLMAGDGVSIIPDPNAHSITIDVNMLGLAVCFSISQISENV
jgi:hypothetical protein